MAPELGRPIHREVRDGVPVFWTSEAPRTAGALMFRAGCCDETVATRGITHFVEHLALFKLGFDPRLERNGMVGGTHTVFWATGTPSEVASFLRHVSSAVAGLPLDRLEAESRVLRTEAAGRQVGPIERFLWYRFGARGHGLGFLPEFLLHAPDPLAVRTWAADRFTAENAVAWFSGPLPDDLRFDELPRGRRIPCVEPDTMPGLCTPSVLQGIEGAIGCSFLSDRNDWVGFPLWVATVRLMQRLRYQDGITYSVEHALQHLSSSRSHAAIWAACLTKHAEAVQDGLFEVFEDLARNGPSSAELQQGHEMWIQRAGARDSILDDLDSTATNELFGAPIQSLQQYLDEFDGRSSDRWAASVRAAMDTAIFVLPPGCEPHGGLVPYPLWSDSIATGRKYRSIAQRYPWSKKLPELVVGKKGVSVVNPNGQAVTVSYDACAGAVIDADGTLQLFGEDGFSVAIASREWRDGEHARSEVLRALPLDCLIEFPRR